ncbi:MAG TPA: DUF692 domain-containing protein [Thermoanaerobaculia bacterium]|nr:DUF692 domain-containing protein [Thermoanaerobaculia bacterium]
MRVGLGWRRELGASILAHLDEIDVVEVLAEPLFAATAAEKRAFRFLAAHVPIVVHGTTLGLASTDGMERHRLESLARLMEWLQPEGWSEHLAFVRAGGIEIGHLAAPPRNDETLAALADNVAEARRIVGSVPLLENVASLIEPPCSIYSEGEWLDVVPRVTGCKLLLDLHNLYANATNFGFDVALPREHVGMVHLAGGRAIGGNRILDDHLHAVPDVLYEMLGEVGNTTVIIERDGNYPPFEELLAEVRRAREACQPACSIS